VCFNVQFCPLCPGPRAYEVTLQVHMTGAGTVAVANKKIITEYTKNLQAAGLTVSMAPDDEFEGGDGDQEDDGS
jgi:ATP-dependent Clp protease adapter protein ClpS